MKTLQYLCYESLAESIYNAPALIQEMVIGETKKLLEKRIKEEVAVEVEKRVKTQVFNKAIDLFAILIPDIVTDIVACTVNDNRLRKPYKRIYTQLGDDNIDLLLEASETIARRCIIERLENGEDSFYEYDSDSNDEIDYFHENEY